MLCENHLFVNHAVCRVLDGCKSTLVKEGISSSLSAGDGDQQANVAYFRQFNIAAGDTLVLEMDALPRHDGEFTAIETIKTLSLMNISSKSDAVVTSASPDGLFVPGLHPGTLSPRGVYTTRDGITGWSTSGFVNKTIELDNASPSEAIILVYVDGVA